MSENNIDKFSLDEILSEYTPKTAKSSGEMDVEDIINETNLHTAMAASAEMADRGQESAETASSENPESTVAAAEADESAAHEANADTAEADKKHEGFFDSHLRPIGEKVINKLEEQAEEFDEAVAGEEADDVPEEELGDEFEGSADEFYDNAFGSVVDENAEEAAEDEEEYAEDTEPVINEETQPEAEEPNEAYEDDTYGDDGDDENEAESEPLKNTRGTRFMFRTEEYVDEDKRPSSQSEYTKKEDAPKIMEQIQRLRSNLTVRAAVLLFAALFSLFITVANDLSLPLAAVFDRTVNPSAFIFTNTILAIVAVGFSYSVIVNGIKSIFSRRPDSDSVAALNMIAAILAGLVTLFDPESLKASFFHIYTSSAILGMLCNTLGKLCIVRRTQRNFEFVAETENFSAVELVDDDQTVAYLTNGSAGKRKELAVMRRTGFIKDFMKNSYSSDLADSYAEKTTPLMLAAALAVGLLSIVFEKNSSGAAEKLFVFLASVSGTLAISSSVGLALIVNRPMAKASKRLSEYSGVILGYSSVEEFAEVNSVVIDSGHLFPTGTVEFVNLKMLGSVMIDQAIIYAASMAQAGRSVTIPAFYKMLRGKSDMILDVKGCTSEDNLGVSGWIENKRVLLGSRKLMERHGVEGLPSESAEENFADGNGIMYLAVSGQAAMMFAVQLSVGPAAERWVQEMEDESIDIHVRCSDGFITRELLSQLFDISASSIRLLPSACDGDCEQLMEYKESVSASMFCSGHLPSFSMLLVAAKRLKFVANMGVALQYGAMVLGIVISVIMMLTGSFAQITPTIVVIYNLAFLLLTMLIQGMKKI